MVVLGMRPADTELTWLRRLRGRNNGQVPTAYYERPGRTERAAIYLFEKRTDLSALSAYVSAQVGLQHYRGTVTVTVRVDVLPDASVQAIVIV